MSQKLGAKGKRINNPNRLEYDPTPKFNWFEKNAKSENLHDRKTH